MLREEDTERPGTSPLLDEKRKGIFHCAGCDLPVYSSETKYESGTGWPSFWDALPNAVGTKTGQFPVHDAGRSAIAAVAAGISATYSTMVRRRPASAIASMGWR